MLTSPALLLASFLDDLPPERFDMYTYVSEAYGGTACLAGWTCRFNDVSYGYGDALPKARSILGITRSEGGDMFCTTAMWDEDLDKPHPFTPKDAALMLRTFAATGKVSWEIARQYSSKPHTGEMRNDRSCMES